MKDMDVNSSETQRKLYNKIFRYTTNSISKRSLTWGINVTLFLCLFVNGCCSYRTENRLQQISEISSGDPKTSAYFIINYDIGGGISNTSTINRFRNIVLETTKKYSLFSNIILDESQSSRANLHIEINIEERDPRKINIPNFSV